MRKSPRRSRAFSLVEVVLAIGVVSFAFVAIMGLLPAGMSQFRKAIDTTMAADIAQRIISDAQQADFDTLTNGPSNGLANSPYQYYRYFDERGVEVIPQSNTAATSPSSLAQSEKQKVVYTVSTRVMPQLLRTDLTAQLATVTVQVMNNPGFAVPVLDSTTLLVAPATKTTNTGFSVLTFSAQVAPNSFSPNYTYSP